MTAPPLFRPPIPAAAAAPTRTGGADRRPRRAGLAHVRLVPRLLREYGALTRAAMRVYLPRGEPRRYLYDLVSDYPRRGGAMLRPTLCIATARAFGGRVEEVLRSAAAIELLHNALLIHDDVEDGSEERRGAPTLHARHGVPLAINGGNALTNVSLQPLVDNVVDLGPRLTLRVLEETERMARHSAEGQAVELGWIRDNVVELEARDYLWLVLKKTCWYTTIYPCRVGALIATRDGFELDALVRFGFFLGAAFQIQDDVLNLIGDRRRYGKELEGDLWEGKRTLMMIHLLGVCDAEERARLTALLRRGRRERTAAEVRWLRRRMERYGSIDYARETAHGLAGAALHEYRVTFSTLPPSRDKNLLEGLVGWVFERTI